MSVALRLDAFSDGPAELHSICSTSDHIPSYSTLPQLTFRVLNRLQKKANANDDDLALLFHTKLMPARTKWFQLWPLAMTRYRCGATPQIVGTVTAATLSIVPSTAILCLTANPSLRCVALLNT